MTLIACLAKVEPLDLETGNRIAIHLSAHQDRRVTGLGGKVWEPAITAAPSVGIALWNGDFLAAVEPAGATLPINMTVVKNTWPDADRYSWAGAPVTIYAEELGEGWPWRKRFIGRVNNLARKSQVLTLTAEVDKEPHAKNLLTATYAGTEGIEGGTDLKNRVKPLVIGWARNVEPVLIDAENSVYQFSAYGPIEAVTTLFERGSPFPDAMADHADYTALVAATIPPGKWATCLASGLIRLGAPAYGVITADLKGHKVGEVTPRLTGAVITAIAAIAGVDTDLLDADSLAALDLAVPFPINIVQTDQITFLDLAKAMALACNAQAGIGLTGTFFAAPVSLAPIDDPELIMVLNAQGRALPQITASEEAAVSVPYWRTVLGANRNWRVQTAEEIAFTTELRDLGDYDDAVTYREGNQVKTENGAGWLYVNPVASAGNDPPIWPTTSNAWWENTLPPTTANDLTYADGTPLEDLKPAEPQADATSLITGPADIVIDTDGLGVITSALPKLVSYRLTRYGVDVTGDAEWGVTAVAGTLSASIGTATGNLMIDAAIGAISNALLALTATREGLVRSLVVRLRKIPAALSGTSTGFSGTTSSTTMVAVSPEIPVTVGASGEVDLTAAYTFDTVAGSGLDAMLLQWHRWNGSAWVSVQSPVESELRAGYYDFGDNGGSTYVQGSGLAAVAVTGLTPSAAEKFQLFAGNYDGTNTLTITGTASAATF